MWTHHILPSTQQLIGVSSLRLWWIRALSGELSYKSLCGHAFLFLLDKYLGWKLQSWITILCLTFGKTAKLFSKTAASCTFPPGMYYSSLCSASSIFAAVCLCLGVRETFHPLAHSTDVCSSWLWARPDSGHWKSIQVSHVGSWDSSIPIHHLLAPGVRISRNLEQGIEPGLELRCLDVEYWHPSH